MKHIMFLTAADADAFLADVQQKGATLGSATYTRRTTTTDGTVADAEAGAEDDRVAELDGPGAHESSSMRSMARRASVAVLGSRTISGPPVSSAARILLRVDRRMCGQMLHGWM